MQRYAILKGRTGPSTAGPFESHGLEGAAPRVFQPRVEVAELKAQEVIEEARDPDTAAIARVMPTKLIKPLDIPGMPAATNTWGIDAVGAGASGFTGDNVVVAVLDTGIDKSHPAFQGVTIIEKDFSGSGNGDVQGHGTHCAGTIFGRDVNGTRIGVARGVKRALIGKVLGNDGSGGSDMIFNGIQWAVQEGANVISMSLGFDFPGLVNELVEGNGLPIDLATSIALEGYRGNLRMFDALMAMVRANAAFTEGTVLVAAAGNESRRDDNPDFEIGASIPAAADGVVSVAALAQGNGQGMGVASFSNTFAQISGPGVNILSAKAGGGLRALNGTSMACPHVAGVTALWWEAVRQSAVRPSAAVVISKLMANARTTGFSPGVDPVDRGVGIAMSP